MSSFFFEFLSRNSCFNFSSGVGTFLTLKLIDICCVKVSRVILPSINSSCFLLSSNAKVPSSFCVGCWQYGSIYLLLLLILIKQSKNSCPCSWWDLLFVNKIVTTEPDQHILKYANSKLNNTYFSRNLSIYIGWSFFSEETIFTSISSFKITDSKNCTDGLIISLIG